MFSLIPEKDSSDSTESSESGESPDSTVFDNLWSINGNLCFSNLQSVTAHFLSKLSRTSVLDQKNAPNSSIFLARKIFFQKCPTFFVFPKFPLTICNPQGWTRWTRWTHRLRDYTDSISLSSPHFPLPLKCIVSLLFLLFLEKKSGNKCKVESIYYLCDVKDQKSTINCLRHW